MLNAPRLKTEIKNIINILLGVVLLFGATSFSLLAQEDPTPTVTLQSTRGSTRQLIEELEKASGWTISYSNRMCLKEVHRQQKSTQSLLQHLNELFADCPFAHTVRDQRIVLRPLNPDEYSYRVSGFVVDRQSGETLPAANIYDPQTGKGTVSNSFGYFSLQLPVGVHRLRASYVGYSGQTAELNLRADTVMNFRLQGTLLLSEIQVEAPRPRDLRYTTPMGSTLIPVQEIRQTPALLGETDLVKNIQMLPGIQGGSEGFSGLYVRGGGPDQNLILLDDVPVYNIGHLLGFFSIFNADAVKHAEVYKGAFPARYGGRLSSVIDIRMFEGNNEKLQGTLNLGLLSSGLSLDGPVKKDVSGFALSFRRTYLDLIAELAQRGNDESTNYYFFDLNGKYNHRINERHRLYLNFYWGRDKYFTNYNFQRPDDAGNNGVGQGTLSDQNDAGWGNLVTGLRWNYLINPKLFANVTGTYSDYRFFIGVQRNNRIENNWDSFEQRYMSGIRDYGLKVDFDYYPRNNHLIKFGLGAIRHDFNPGIDVIQEDSSSEGQVETTIGEINLTGWESHFYLEDEWTFREKLRINAGLRTVIFSGGQENYHSIEPRLGLNYRLSTTSSLRAGYTRMSQYIHLVSSSNVALPTDLWLPVTDRIPPQSSVQYNLGLNHYLSKDGMYSLNLDLYYKELDHLLHYKESTGFFDYSTDWEDKLTSGYGESYGLELLLRKTQGALTGWAGYTLAKTTNTYPQLNKGQAFPARFDRRHDFNLSLSYRFSERTDGGLMWQYGSGTPVTLPVEKYYAPDYPHLQPSGQGGFSENATAINGLRMPAFHRLDIGFNFYKQRTRTQRIWSVGLINVYGRQNPFVLYFADNSSSDAGAATRQLKQLSLFPFPIPYFKYTLKF